jgi:excisionase family DNA binding protein
MTAGIPSTINIEQASSIIGLPVRTTYRAAARGQIPCIRIGRRLLVPTKRLLDMLGLDPEDAAAVLVDEQQPA